MAHEILPNGIYSHDEVAEILGIKGLTFTNSKKYKPLREKRTLGRQNGRYIGADVLAFLESTRESEKPKARGRKRIDVQAA